MTRIKILITNNYHAPTSPQIQPISYWCDRREGKRIRGLKTKNMQANLFDIPTTANKYVKGAVISECKKYRYRLWRIWDETKPLVLWVMHNPSKADGEIDDRTITRCVGFTKAWGYGGFYVGNLCPYRATNPEELLQQPTEEVIPIDNAHHLREMIKICQLHVLAFGNPVLKAMKFEYFSEIWHYLKLTKEGNPCHPLYLPSTLIPVRFTTSKDHQ